MRRPRTKLALACGVAAVLALAALGWLAVQRWTLSAAERNLVGLWQQKRDNAPVTDPIVEFEFTADRIVTLINRDAVTGAITFMSAEYDDWRLKGNELWLRRTPPTGPTPFWRRLGWWNRPTASIDVLMLTADGPDRYHYVMTRCDQFPVHQLLPPPSGTRTRVTPPTTP